MARSSRDAQARHSHSLLAEIKQEFAALYEHVDAIHLGFALLDSLYGDEP